MKYSENKTKNLKTFYLLFQQFSLLNCESGRKGMGIKCFAYNNFRKYASYLIFLVLSNNSYKHSIIPEKYERDLVKTNNLLITLLLKVK